MTRIAALALMLLLAAPAAAVAGWEKAKRVPESRPLPDPSSDAEIVGYAESSALKVRVRGGEVVTVPGSEGAVQARADAGADGTVALAWMVEETCGGRVSCRQRVLATVWRRGEAPAPGRMLHPAGMEAQDPDVGVGDDGTVLVAFDEAVDEEPVGLRAAVGRAGAPLALAEVSARRPQSASIVTVRGAPQLAWFERGRRGATVVRVLDAEGGRLGRARRETAVRSRDRTQVELLRSRRGDRLLTWPDRRRGRWRFSVAAPGRDLGAARTVVADRVASGLGEAGDYAVLLRRAPTEAQRLGLLRGRTGRRGVRHQRLDRPHFPVYESEFTAWVALDRRGRAFVVYETQPSTSRPGIGIAGLSAPRGRRLGGGRVISTRRAGAFCTDPVAVVTGVGRAVARWECSLEGPPYRLVEQARFR